jgi:hypothetical protein
VLKLVAEPPGTRAGGIETLDAQLTFCREVELRHSRLVDRNGPRRCDEPAAQRSKRLPLPLRVQIQLQPDGIGSASVNCFLTLRAETGNRTSSRLYYTIYESDLADDFDGSDVNGVLKRKRI